MKTNQMDVPHDFQKLFEIMNSPACLSMLETLTGIKNLIADKQMGSGGVHSSKNGGYLNIHADFTIHPYNKTWERKINLLIYFNEEWEDEWNGNLELWEEDMSSCLVKVKPIFNRAVIFNTSATSWHGHPTPIVCPDHIKRKSLAMYYYKDNPDVKSCATNYQSTPEDNLLRSCAIWLDKSLVSFVHRMKRTFNLSDKWFERIYDLGKKSKNQTEK